MYLRKNLSCTGWQLLLCLLFVVPAATWAQESEESATESVVVGEPAPDFTLSSADGKEFTLSQCNSDDGKYVVAIFVRAHW